MSGHLGLLSDIVSSNANEGADGDSFVRDDEAFNFEEFENDLDFINEHLNDDENSEKDDACVSPRSDNEAEVKERSCDESDASVASGQPELGHPVNRDESYTSPGDSDDEEEYFDIEDETTERQRNTSFHVPDSTEYSESFDSDTENSKEDSLPTKSEEDIDDCGRDNTGGEEKIDHEKCDKAQDPESLRPEIQNCTKCDCRFTKMHILELPELNELFSQDKECKRMKHTRNKKQTVKANKRKTKKRKISKIDLKVESGERISDVVAFARKDPVDTGWGKSSNESLLQWLKEKNREARRKRMAEKRAKKNEQMVKKLKEADKLCRKELSEKKVGEWMKAKTRESQLSRGTSFSKFVSVRGETEQFDIEDFAPEGYTVINSFANKPAEIIDGKSNLASAGNRSEVIGKTRSKRETSNVRPAKKINAKLEFTGLMKSTSDNRTKNGNGNSTLKAEGRQKEEEGKCKTEIRKTYNEWLRNKKSMLSRNKTAQKNSGNDPDDMKLFAKERYRRHQIKEAYRKNVNSNQPTPFKEEMHEPKKSGKKQQQYKWAEKILDFDGQICKDQQKSDKVSLQEVSKHQDDSNIVVDIEVSEKL